MRLALPLLLIVFVILLFMFALTNDARVDVTLGGTTYRGVHLTIVVLVSLVIGVVFTGILALIEGASSRLTALRLRRRIDKLETEMHFLRTEHSESSRIEPESTDGTARDYPPAEAEDRRRTGHPPMAPVYDPESRAEGD